LPRLHASAPCRSAAAAHGPPSSPPPQVTITHDGKTTTLDVPDGKPILEVALDKGIDLPHDCKLGVCMTCPAKLVSGKVDQTGCMLSDDVEEKGFTLLCMAVPQADCEIVTCTEVRLGGARWEGALADWRTRRRGPGG
jgi:2Fe-2S type ferredoxin